MATPMRISCDWARLEKTRARKVRPRRFITHPPLGFADGLYKRPTLPTSFVYMLEKAIRAAEAVIYYASGALMLALTAVILYAVVARYFFNAAPAWSDEVPRVIFLWGTYIGMALAARRGQSLRVTFVLERLPPLGRLWLEMFMHVSIFVMLAFLLWYNVPVIQLGGQTQMLATQWAA